VREPEPMPGYPVVAQAVALANNLGFIACCTPEQGELLRVLARGRAGGVIGETGTGCGAGLAWMASAIGPETRLVSIAIDATRAATCQALFAALPNVTVLHGDWRLIIEYGPFDLLVLDGGGAANGLMTHRRTR
jgi:predicted O-methyltransferase YrrM